MPVKNPRNKKTERKPDGFRSVFLFLVLRPDPEDFTQNPSEELGALRITTFKKISPFCFHLQIMTPNAIIPKPKSSSNSHEGSTSVRTIPSPSASSNSP